MCKSGQMDLDSLIQNAQQTQNLKDLRSYSVFGYGTNKQRRASWRLLLDIQDYNPTVSPSKSGKFCSQVEKDACRSCHHIKSKKFQQHKREQLAKVILCVFDRNPDLHYTQGFHDVASIILTFAREPLAVLILEALGKGHLSPFLFKDFSGFSSILNFIPPLLKHVDNELYNLFDENGMDSSFATSYVGTLYTHNASTLEEALRYLDFFIACHPLMPVYSLVTLINQKRNELIASGDDPGTLTCSLRELLVGTDVNVIIQNSVSLFKEFPPTQVLIQNVDLKISRNCFFMNPSADFPYEYSDFPVFDKFPKKLYKSRLDETTSNSLIRGIISALAIAAAIGMRVLL